MHKISKLIFLLFLTYISFKIFQKEEPFLLHFANLNFHEAGHTLFIFFGDFLHVLGGSFLQLFIPIIFMLYFLRRSEYFSSTVMLWWLGDNLTDVGIYMADARAQVLPLLGGDKSGHDWTYLLNKLSIIKYDVILGNTTWAIGIIIIIFSIGLGAYLTFNEDTKKHSLF